MTSTEETDSKGAAELDSMIVTRKDIHLKQGIDITNIFGYKSSRMSEGTECRTDQVTLVVAEDRRKNTSQFDLAYIDVGGIEVLAAFDTCSTATLIYRELIEGGQLEVTVTTNNSNINGIWGVAKGRVVAIILENQNGDKSIMIHAAVVDEISTLQRKDEQRFNELTRLSAEALKK